MWTSERVKHHHWPSLKVRVTTVWSTATVLELLSCWSWVFYIWIYPEFSESACHVVYLLLSRKWWCHNNILFDLSNSCYCKTSMGSVRSTQLSIFKSNLPRADNQPFPWCGYHCMVSHEDIIVPLSLFLAMIDYLALLIPSCHQNYIKYHFPHNAWFQSSQTDEGLTNAMKQYVLRIRRYVHQTSPSEPHDPIR